MKFLWPPLLSICMTYCKAVLLPIANSTSEGRVSRYRSWWETAFSWLQIVCGDNQCWEIKQSTHWLHFNGLSLRLWPHHSALRSHMLSCESQKRKYLSILVVRPEIAKWVDPYCLLSNFIWNIIKCTPFFSLYENVCLFYTFIRAH